MRLIEPSPRSTASLGALLVVAFAAQAGGCYRPNIKDGSIRCDKTFEEDFQCPEGFRCAVDDHCWRDPTQVKPDGGKPMCTLPKVTALCADPPAAGQACNPTCQTGCECGRCNVVAGVPTCVAPGAVKLGDVCKVGAQDDCAPGLYCAKEACGDNLGRCYRHCTTSDQCTGSVCSFSIEATAFKLCEVAPQACDPVKDMGCPSASLHCYITSGDQTLCDCARNGTKGMAGDPCVFYSDCAPGFVCFQSAGEEPKCRAACNIAAPVCGAGEACTGGTKYGHCGG